MRDFFGLDDPWLRPRPPISRADWIIAGAIFVCAGLRLELIRSYGVWDDAQPA